MEHITHWTERGTEDFFYSIASDFIDQLQEKMEALGMKQSQLAEAARVSKSYVSKVFKNPGNLSLETLVKFARTVGMKVSIVAYEDKNDPDNTRGPINSDIFRLCWERAERPADMWAIKEMAVARTNSLSINHRLANFELGWQVFPQTNTGARSRSTNTVARFPSNPTGPKMITSTDWNATQKRLTLEV